MTNYWLKIVSRAPDKRVTVVGLVGGIDVSIRAGTFQVYGRDDGADWQPDGISYECVDHPTGCRTFVPVAQIARIVMEDR